jgi:hypothetical protein
MMLLNNKYKEDQANKGLIEGLNNTQISSSVIGDNGFDSKNHKILTVPEKEPPKAALLPMSPLAASTTVVNLLLATGPFRYDA